MSGLLVNPSAASAGTGLSPGARFGSGLAGVAGTVATGNPLVGQLLSSGIQFGGNLLSKLFDQRLSKDLYDYQTDYKKLSDAMIRAGINPAAAHQGLSGASPSMQAVSGHAAPDLSGIGSLMLEQQRNPSIIAKNEADTMLNKVRVGEIEQIMRYNPIRWHAEVRQALSQVESNTANSFYLNSLARTVEQKRPYEIAGLYYGLQQTIAMIQNYKAQSRLFGSEAGYFDQKTKNEKKLGFKMNIENSFLRMGFNINEPPTRSLLRLIMTNPQAGIGVLDSGMKFLDIVDGKVTEKLGKNWKKFAAAGVALHYVNNRLGEHNTKKSQRTLNKIRSLQGMAGIAGSLITGSPLPAAVGSYMNGSNSSNTLEPLPDYFGKVMSGDVDPIWDMW